MAEWRSDDRKHTFRGGKIYLSTTQQGQPAEIDISMNLTNFERLLLKFLGEMLEDLEKK